MKNVEIYIKPDCPYCQRALELLRNKEAPLTIIDLYETPERREEMITRAQRQTVPQIFIGGQHIGGCSDLEALEEAGKLNAYLED